MVRCLRRNLLIDMKLNTLQAADVTEKKVFLLADTDVPLSADGAILDDTRLCCAVPTIEYLLKHSARVIVAGKLGRPHGEFAPSLSLEPVAAWLEQKFGVWNAETKMQKEAIGSFEGWRITPQLFLLENIRFHREEEENNTDFAKKLASLADIYVNDAFALSHRAHASTVGVPQFLSHFAGLHLQKEVEALEGVMSNPKRPLVVIIGGAKLETKLPLVEKMHHIADFVLVGGKIAREEGELIKVQHETLEPLQNGHKSILLVSELNSEGTDMSDASVENFRQVIATAKTIIWNGPVGKMDELTGGGTEKGTLQLAQAIIDSGAYSVVGGGDTLEFLQKKGLVDKFNFCSTGGGAMLSLLSGQKLPGIEALKVDSSIVLQKEF